MKFLSMTLVFVVVTVACTPTGLRSPGPADEYAWINRNITTPEEVRSEILQCGDWRFPSNVKARDGESSDNARARIQECMFAKGFHLKSGSGGTCSNPNYRAELPACLNAPVRPGNGYYGQ